MRAAVLALALAMLVTGTINTVSVKFQDMTMVGRDAEGQPIYFRHPAIQAAFMFLGESLCLVPYFVLRWRKAARRRAGLEPESKRPKQPRSFFLRRALMFAIPALCDSVASTLLNLGLFYTNASTYQMLRGTLVLFAGMFTLLILRRRLFIHHWLGMLLITAGAAIVGAASIVYAPHAPQPPSPSPSASPTAGGFGELGSAAEALSQLWSHWNPVTRAGLVVQRLREEGSADPLFGDIMVVVAQGFAALQFILEEKLLGSFRMQPLVAVGLEGMWGVLLCLVALPVLGQVRDSKGLPLDDLPGAVREIASNPKLALAVTIGILSIGFFNFFGLSVTKALSGASRATIDACRTMFVWLFALWAGWETFHGLQVVGFVVLFSGTSLYNEILRSCLPHAYPPASAHDAYQSLEDDSVSSTSSQGSGGPQGDGDLEAPLLGAAHQPDGQGGRRNGNGSGGVGGGGGPRAAHAAPMAMQRHQEAQYHMARSMRLGVTTLSPRALDEDPTPFSNDRIPVSDILDVSPISASLATNPDSRALTMYSQASEGLSESGAEAMAPSGGAGAGVAGAGSSRGQGQGQLAAEGGGRQAAGGQGLVVGSGWGGGGTRTTQPAAAGVPASVPPSVAQASSAVNTTAPRSSPEPMLPAIAPATPARPAHGPPAGVAVPGPQPPAPHPQSVLEPPPQPGPGPEASTGGTAAQQASAGAAAGAAAAAGGFVMPARGVGGLTREQEAAPEEVMHPTHAYHPGGGLQHALAAAGDPAAHVEGAAAPGSAGGGGAPRPSVGSGARPEGGAAGQPAASGAVVHEAAAALVPAAPPAAGPPMAAPVVPAPSGVPSAATGAAAAGAQPASVPKAAAPTLVPAPGGAAAAATDTVAAGAQSVSVPKAAGLPLAAALVPAPGSASAAATSTVAAGAQPIVPAPAPGGEEADEEEEEDASVPSTSSNVQKPGSSGAAPSGGAAGKKKKKKGKKK